MTVWCITGRTECRPAPRNVSLLLIAIAKSQARVSWVPFVYGYEKLMDCKTTNRLRHCFDLLIAPNHESSTKEHPSIDRRRTIHLLTHISPPREKNAATSLFGATTPSLWRHPKRGASKLHSSPPQVINRRWSPPWRAAMDGRAVP